MLVQPALFATRKYFPKLTFHQVHNYHFPISLLENYVLYFNLSENSSKNLADKSTY